MATVKSEEKVSPAFKQAIQTKLESLAQQDFAFSMKYQNASKNLNDCITYILNQVKQSGVHGFEDSEIYGMAIHYYDEENIDIGSKISCEVVVNHTVQLTDEEKVAAKERAMKELVDQHKNKMLKKTPVITKPTVQATEVKPAGPAEQASLF